MDIDILNERPHRDTRVKAEFWTLQSAGIKFGAAPKYVRINGTEERIRLPMCRDAPEYKGAKPSFHTHDADAGQPPRFIKM
jgi:hypothetical protein